MKFHFKLYRNMEIFSYRLRTFTWMFAALVAFTPSCSLEEQGASSLRAHEDNIQGVFHAFSSGNGPRYCKYCHGEALQGGANGEPSCFQCHGENWNETDPNLPRGDADHNIDNGGFLHHSGIASPTTNCTACHGANLQGSQAKIGNPSCFLCHEQKW